MQRDMQGAVATKLLNPASAADTAGATGSWVAIPAGHEGDIEFVQEVGAITGSITGKIQTADDNSGTNAADVTLNEAANFGLVNSSNAAVRRSVQRSALSLYVRFVGTIVTGPAIVGCSMFSVPKQ